MRNRELDAFEERVSEDSTMLDWLADKERSLRIFQGGYPINNEITSSVQSAKQDYRAALRGVLRDAMRNADTEIERCHNNYNLNSAQAEIGQCHEEKAEMDEDSKLLEWLAEVEFEHPTVVFTLSNGKEIRVRLREDGDYPYLDVYGLEQNRIPVRCDGGREAMIEKNDQAAEPMTVDVDVLIDHLLNKKSLRKAIYSDLFLRTCFERIVELARQAEAVRKIVERFPATIVED